MGSSAKGHTSLSDVTFADGLSSYIYSYGCNIFSFLHSPADTNRNDAAGVEGDAVEGVLAELAESEGGSAVDTALLAHHVAHQRSHGTESPELVTVVAPAAAVGDGGR